jgi:hypothetical protein
MKPILTSPVFAGAAGSCVAFGAGEAQAVSKMVTKMITERALNHLLDMSSSPYLVWVLALRGQTKA